MTTRTFGIVAIILAVTLPPVGAIIGLLVLRNASKFGDRKVGLTAVWLGGVLSVVALVAAMVPALLFAWL